MAGDHTDEGHKGVLTATKIQKNVTERCGPEMASSTFRAMTPPRTAETPAITSMTWRAKHTGGVTRGLCLMLQAGRGT